VAVAGSLAWRPDLAAADFALYEVLTMTENPTFAAARRDQRVSGAEPAPPAAPSDGDTVTRTSTVTSESPTFVSETRAERMVVATPAEPGSPAGSTMATRTTMFSGDPAYRGVQMVWFLLGVTELIIGLRVVFRALGATDTGFVSLIYGLGGALVAPFRGIPNWTSGTTVVEVGSIVAMVVYLLAAYLVIKLVRIVAAPHRPAAA
jgi:hypothetical protein